MPVATRPAIDRVMPRVIEVGSCWVFTGALSAAGYGVVGAGGRGAGNAFTHRVTYTYFVADVPDGLDLDHLCRNRACCNPWHLEPVTRLENVRRGLRGPGYGPRERTHCKRGHEFTPENTYQGKRQRKCRTCIRERAKDIDTYLIEDATHD